MSCRRGPLCAPWPDQSGAVVDLRTERVDPSHFSKLESFEDLSQIKAPWLGSWCRTNKTSTLVKYGSSFGCRVITQLGFISQDD